MFIQRTELSGLSGKSVACRPDLIQIKDFRRPKNYSPADQYSIRESMGGYGIGLQLQGRQAVHDRDGRVGRDRHAGRRFHRRTIGVASIKFRYSVVNLWSSATVAYQRRDFCVRHLRPIRHFVLRRAAYLSGQAVLRSAGGIYVLGLASSIGIGGHHVADGFYAR